MNRRVLVLSHGHPDFSKGGAEMAAHGLYRGLNAVHGWDAWFVARHGVAGLKRPGRVFIAHDAPRELLFEGDTDSMYFSARGGEALVREFAALLDQLRPDVVHFHHYWQVGIELIRAVKRFNPRVPVVLTLHEFLAICAQNGQMLKGDGQLCTRGSPGLCHACMPVHSVDDFLLRRHYIRSFFDQVDRFIAPSHFLRDRYIAWGVQAERITVLENGQEDRCARAAVDDQAGAQPRVRFAFFGQITPYKGVDVLLEAFGLLPAALKKKLQLEIHGGANHQLPAEAQTRLTALRATAHRNVRFFGPYAPEQQQRLIQGADWVVVPSIWWENSPMVIQEAFLHGRPVICADIGGMAEKVVDGVTGLHFRARSAADLARVLERAATAPGLWQALAANIQRPPSIIDSAVSHCDLYLQLIDANVAAAA